MVDENHFLCYSENATSHCAKSAEVSMFLLMACVFPSIELNSDSDALAPFEDPDVETGSEMTTDTGEIDDTGDSAEICEFPIAVPLYLDPQRELVSCLPSETWSLGAVQGIEPGGGENIFFAAVSLGDVTPGDNVVRGGESEIAVIGTEDPSSASEILARLHSADIATGYETGEIAPFAIGEWTGGLYEATVASGASESYPDGASVIRSAVQVDEGRVLVILAGYGQWSDSSSRLKGLSTAWSIVEDARVEYAQ
ncbi:MAG: hypothetical protein AAB473_02225 [Patescibacteria group bacterium]